MSGQTDQSRPVSRVSVVKALTQIRALCRDAWSEGGYEGGDAVISADDIRAVLDAVSVDATPAQGIDRDALRDVLWSVRPVGASEQWAERATDAVLALVRPVEGIVLTPEEAALVLPYIERAIETYPWEDDGPLRALASHLEAS